MLMKKYKKLSNESGCLVNSLGLTVKAGKDANALKKNRFLDILPFDQNRVKIGSQGFPWDYINASYIPFADNDDQIEFIASQDPIDGFLEIFWEMIWDQNINCIIMMTRTMEGFSEEFLQYWPLVIDCSNLYGENNKFKITFVEESEQSSHTERTIIAENMKTNDERKIIQIHMHGWFDHSSPNLDNFDKILFRFHEITNDNINHPCLVHCSNGVGRTGTFICIARIIKELLNQCQEINIYDQVLKLRTFRDHMVQHEAQYIFIYDFINYFLSKYMKVLEGEDSVYTYID